MARIWYFLICKIIRYDTKDGEVTLPFVFEFYTKREGNMYNSLIKIGDNKSNVKIKKVRMVFKWDM